MDDEESSNWNSHQTIKIMKTKIILGASALWLAVAPNLIGQDLARNPGVDSVLLAYDQPQPSAQAADASNVPATDTPVTVPATGSSSTGPLAAAKDADPWQFNTAPYMWFVQVNGKVKVLDHSANVNVNFDEIFNHLRGPPLMLNLEVRKKKFGFYTAPLYVKLAADASEHAGPLTLDGEDTLTLWIVESGGFYQIAELGEKNPLTVDALAGVRYWNIDNNLVLNDPSHIINFNHHNTLDLWDPFIGLRLQKNLTEKLSVSLTGEYGGFAISSSTPNDSWEAVGTVGYAFTRRFTCLAGYRALGLSTYNQSGVVGGGNMRANIILQGAVVGFEFRF